MKTLLFSLTTLLGVTFGSAGVTVTNLLGDLSPELGVSYSDLSTHRGVATREDAFAYSALVGVPFKGAHLSLGIDLHDVDGHTEKDWSVAYARPVEVFGQSLGMKAHFKTIDSSYGAWEEAGVALTYAHNVADLTATVWHEVDSDGSYGVEIMVSRDFTTPVENLTVTPFVAVNVADEYNAVEAGVSADYDLGNGLSAAAKVSYNDNDVDGSAHTLDHDWGVGVGVNYKF
jgi:hypothetical protein